MSYIGTTSQHLKNRISQHRRDCRPPIKNESATALCTHTARTGHVFKYDEVEVLDQHRHNGKREVLEALHIKKNIDRVVNKRTDSENINGMYANLIRMQANDQDTSTGRPWM